MRGHRGFVLVLLLLAASGAGVLLGAVEPGVSLSSVLEVWGDVLRDTDQFGLRFTRASDREEIELGRELAIQAITWYRELPQRAKYVSAIGNALRPYLHRTGIPYEFHVIESTQINAFALPGGQVFVMTGMLDFLQSEAELAAILGHEMSHVDLRHCIERFQYELALKKFGMRDLGQLTEVARSVLTVGYQKYQEVEADAQGVRMSIEAGYEPRAGTAVFDRLTERFGRYVAAAAKTPAGEAIRALDVAMGSYLQSHPPSEDRVLRLKRLELANRGRLSGRDFYVGRENYRLQIPRAEREFPGERRLASEQKPVVSPQIAATPLSAPTGRPAPSTGAPTAPQPAIPPGDYDRAIQDYDQAIRRKPDDALAFNNRGIAYRNKGAYDRAIQDYDEALRLRPDYAEAFANRGFAYRSKGAYDRATQDYDQAIRLQPTNATTWNNRCWTRAIVGQLQAALADCNEALRLRPDFLSARDSRGFTYLKLGEMNRAIADYDTVLLLDPKRAYSLYGRGVAKRKKGDAAGGEADIAAAKAIVPDIAEEFARLGVRPADP